MIPTPEAFMAKLAQNPTEAIAFDRCQPNLSRREHVESVLACVKATLAENAALKAKTAASKAKLQAIEAAKLSQTSIMKTTSSPQATATAAPAAKLTTAEDFQKSIQPPAMRRSEFSKLTNAARNQWIRSGGKLV